VLSSEFPVRRLATRHSLFIPNQYSTPFRGGVEHLSGQMFLFSGDLPESEYKFVLADHAGQGLAVGTWRAKPLQKTSFSLRTSV
jgi:hypothetical protein